MIEQVNKEITKAFEHFNEKDGIKMSDIRVKIVKQNGKLLYSLLNKKDFVRETSLKEMIGSMFSMMASTPLHTAVKNLFTENGLDENNAHVRIFPLPDNSPSTYLFNNGKALKQVEIKELLN